MGIKAAFFFMAVVIAVSANAQSIITKNRLTDFSDVGCSAFSEFVIKNLNSVDYGLDSTGVNYSDQAFQTILNSKSDQEFWKSFFRRVTIYLRMSFKCLPEQS